MNITLNEAQSFQKKLIEQCIKHETTTKAVAIITGFSQRTIQQKVKDYKDKGDAIFIHGNTGKKKPRPVYEELREKIMHIFLNTKVNNINPFQKITYANFKLILEEEYGIYVEKRFLKRLLNSHGYFTPIKHKVKHGESHPIRERKEHMGELVQVDGTPFEWFMDGKKYCIQGFLDDATGYPLGLYMTKNECLQGYMEAFRNMCFDYGLPQTLYPDKASVFFVNNQKKDDGKKHYTQFGLMMERFGVEMFPAHSPQAKGRIERFWQTLQHKLPNIFALKGINTIEKANEYLKNELPKKYKKWFPRTPKSPDSFFVKADMEQINSVLKATFPGKTDRGGVFYLKGYKFFTPELLNKKINICLTEKDGLWIEDAVHPGKKYTPILIETDTSGFMPEVTKDLIERTFLKNAKPKFREVYYDYDLNDIVKQ